MSGQNLRKERPKLTSTSPLVLVGGGVLNDDDLTLIGGHRDSIVAIDGGAGAVLDAGVTPRAVIGDFDSLSDADRAQIPADRLHPIDEQSTTDFDKALRSVAAPLVIGLGVTGGRVDHELAAYHVLAKRVGPPCIIAGAEDIVFLAPPRIDLDLPPGSRLSLFPMAPVTGHSEGLRWPIEGLAFDPVRVIGTSNATTAGQVHLRFDAPGMLIILPRRALTGAIAALTHSDCTRWGDV